MWNLQETERRHKEESSQIQSLFSLEKDKNLKLDHELLETQDLVRSLQVNYMDTHFDEFKYLFRVRMKIWKTWW